QEALRDLAGVGRGGRRVGAENVKRHDRRGGRFTQPSRAQPIHIYRSARWRARAPALHRLPVPLQIATGAVGEAAAFYAVLSGKCGQGAKGTHVLTTVAIAVDAVRRLDQAGTNRSIEVCELGDVLFDQTGDAGRSLRREVHE